MHNCTLTSITWYTNIITHTIANIRYHFNLIPSTHHYVLRSSLPYYITFYPFLCIIAAFTSSLFTLVCVSYQRSQFHFKFDQLVSFSNVFSTPSICSLPHAHYTHLSLNLWVVSTNLLQRPHRTLLSSWILKIFCSNNFQISSQPSIFLMPPLSIGYHLPSTTLGCNRLSDVAEDASVSISFLI